MSWIRGGGKEENKFLNVSQDNTYKFADQKFLRLKIVEKFGSFVRLEFECGLEFAFLR